MLSEEAYIIQGRISQKALDPADVSVVYFCRLLFQVLFWFLFKNQFTYLQKYVHTDEKALELLLTVTMMGSRNILSSVAILKVC